MVRSVDRTDIMAFLSFSISPSLFSFIYFIIFLFCVQSLLFSVPFGNLGGGFQLLVSIPTNNSHLLSAQHALTCYVTSKFALFMIVLFFASKPNLIKAFAVMAISVVDHTHIHLLVTLSKNIRTSYSGTHVYMDNG